MKLNFRKGSAFANKKAHEYLDKKEPEDIKKITIIRHAAIGDMIAARPFIIELKNFFPNAFITLSTVSGYTYGVPDDLIDYTHIINKKNKNGKKTTFLERYKEIKKLPQQDIIFDLTDNSLSLITILVNRPKLKIGYSYRWIRRFFYDISTLRSDFVFETMSMNHQINILGAYTKSYPLEYRLSDKKRKKREPYIVYFAGASIPEKCWGEENFIELLKLMIEKYPNYKHIVLKGIKDDEDFNNIYQPFKNDDRVIHQNTLELSKVYDYLAEASLVIVGDTGLRNMAIGTHTPTIGLMFAFGVSAIRYLPQTKEHEVVYNLDYSRPSPQKVYKTTVELMDRLYEY